VGVFVVVLPRFAEDPQEVFGGLALPGTDAREHVRGGGTFVGDDANFDVEIVDARVHGPLRVTLQRGDGFLGTGHDDFSLPRGVAMDSLMPWDEGETRESPYALSRALARFHELSRTLEPMEPI
jgi:hypothetical protein